MHEGARAMRDRQATTPGVAFDIDGVIRVPNAKPGLEFRLHVTTAEVTLRADPVPPFTTPHYALTWTP